MGSDCMETRPPTIETRPPALIEGLVRRLIPPACREHVLGDLWERHPSASGFLIDAARTIPFVIASQIRRTWIPPLLGMQAVMAFVFFGGPLKNRDGAAPMWVRAAIPAGAAIVGLVLRDVYAVRRADR